MDDFNALDSPSSGGASRPVSADIVSSSGESPSPVDRVHNSPCSSYSVTSNSTGSTRISRGSPPPSVMSIFKIPLRLSEDQIQVIHTAVIQFLVDEGREPDEMSSWQQYPNSTEYRIMCGSAPIDDVDLYVVDLINGHFAVDAVVERKDGNPAFRTRSRYRFSPEVSTDSEEALSGSEGYASGAEDSDSSEAGEYLSGASDGSGASDVSSASLQ